MYEESYYAILRRLGVEPEKLTASSAALVKQLEEMPLDVFALDGQPLEVRVSWWPRSLWFVPSVHDAEALCREGIGQERVWTARELLSVVEGSPWTTEALRMVLLARREFEGEVITVRRLT